MNDLTWFLYFVDISQHFTPLVILFGVALVIIGFVIPPKDVQPFGRDYEFPFQGVGRLKNWFIGWVIAVFVTCLIPSEETMYMMAASEAGEAAITSPQGKEVLDKINTIINNQLDELAKKKEQ